MANTDPEWSRMDAALSREAAYAHPVDRVRRRETHISIVYLAGPYAYKLKKPIDLGILDFRLLETRRRMCDEEVRLNRRLAPELYLGVEPVTRAGDRYTIGGSGTVVDYVVKMVRFDERHLLSARLDAGTLDGALIDRLARRLAAFHCHAPAASFGSGLGSAALLRHQLAVPLDTLSSRLPHGTLDGVRAWSERQLDELDAHLQARARDGFIRECHGDLHLDNIVADNGIAFFDCIEFSDTLRWIDVLNDVAFLVMDLYAHRRGDLAIRMLNRWLEGTGDFRALRALPLYIAYRAVVRGWVCAQRQDAARATCALLSASPSTRACRTYLDVARHMGSVALPGLLLCHGFSGSGKSVASDALAARIGAIRLCADLERKRAAPLCAADPGTLPSRCYEPQAVDEHYTRLCALAGDILRSGITTLVDASFLRRKHRIMFIDLARTIGLPVFVLDFHAPSDVLVARVRSRAAQSAALSPSDADVFVLKQQLEHADPLSQEELAMTVHFDTDLPPLRFLTDTYWAELCSVLDRRGVRSILSHALQSPP